MSETCTDRMKHEKLSISPVGKEELGSIEKEEEPDTEKEGPDIADIEKEELDMGCIVVGTERGRRKKQRPREEQRKRPRISLLL